MRPDRQLLADSIKVQIDAMAPSHAITLAFNRTVPAGQAARTLRHLGALLDRELLGSRWQNKPDLRTTGLFVPEHMDSNSHYHGVLHVHPVYREKFERLLAASIDPLTGEEIRILPLWRFIYAPGSSCVKAYSSSGWGSYMTKDLTEKTLDQVVTL